MLGYHIMLVTLYQSLQLVLSKRIRIRDTIIFSVVLEIEHQSAYYILSKSH